MIENIKRKRKPFPLPDCFFTAANALGIHIPNTLFNVKYRLRRTKNGTEISFVVGPFDKKYTHLGSFTWNISHIENVYPADFDEARKWVAAYASRYGQEVEELKKERIKKATGEDRKLLKAGGCKESWLSSDIPELWAEAMVRCQHPAKFCSDDGYCHYGNCNMEMMERE